MALDINWSLFQPVDIGAKFQQGFEMGRARLEKQQMKSALAAYSQDPTNPQAQNALAAASPQFAMQIAEQKSRQAAEMAERQRLGSYFSDPDPTAARQRALQGGDIDVAKQISELDDDQRKRVSDMYKAAAPFAYQAKSLPPEQRPAYLESIKPQLKAAGWDDSHLANFDPSDAGLDSVITSASTIEQLIDRNKFTWHQEGERPSFATNAMGMPVGSQNPYAQHGTVKPETAHVSDQASYDAVPPGATYTTPDGHVRVKPGAQAQGGQTQPASGNFRP